MPFPTSSIETKQAEVTAKMVTLRADIVAYLAAPSAGTAATVVASRAVAAKSAAAAVLALLQDKDYQPATEAERYYDMAHLIALAVLPSHNEAP
jgi:hypothetical protein